MIDTDYEVPIGLARAFGDVRSPTSTRSDVRSPTSTRSEVRSPTSTRTEVRSPTRTATEAFTQGNFTSTVTGGAGAGATYVTINVPAQNKKKTRASSGSPYKTAADPSPFGFDISKDALDSGGALYSGGSSYTPGLSYAASGAGLASFQAPLCSRDVLRSLGNFQRGLSGIDDALNEDIKIDLNAALEAAQQHNQEKATAVAKMLAEKAEQFRSLAARRNKLTSAARSAYERLRDQVAALDNKAAALMAAGKKEGVQVRKDAKEKAVLAVRYQKIDALATTLTDNAFAQADVVNNMSNVVLAGRPDVLINSIRMYTQLATVSSKARDVRKKQLALLKGGLQGVKPLFIDYFEEELNGIDKVKPEQTVFNGYTIEAVNPGPARRKVKSVSKALRNAVLKVKQAASQTFPKPEPVVPIRMTNFMGLGAVAQVKRPVIVRRPPINIRQIARQGSGAATATLLNSNIRGVTPQQLTAMSQQALALANGAMAVSSADIVAQARRL